MSNITLSINKELLDKSREYAQKNRTTLNALVRSLLEKTVENDSIDWLTDIFQKSEDMKLSSRGQKWTRDSLYDV